MKLTTLGRKVANDSPFFARLADENRTFTARKYDEVIEWFSKNWPDDLSWPLGVPRPSSAPNSEASGNSADHARGPSAGPNAETQRLPPSGGAEAPGAAEVHDVSSSSIPDQAARRAVAS